MIYEAHALAVEDGEKHIILGMKLIEELGLGKVGGYQSSVNLLAPPSAHVDMVQREITAMLGYNEKEQGKLLEMWKNRAENSSFSLDEFSKKAAVAKKAFL